MTAKTTKTKAPDDATLLEMFDTMALVAATDDALRCGHLGRERHPRLLLAPRDKKPSRPGSRRRSCPTTTS